MTDRPTAKAVLSDDMRRVVNEQRLGFVATVCPDGTPNLSPKGTVRAWEDDYLAFVDLASPGTVANIRANPAVEVNVVDPILRKGYRFKGKAEVLTDGDVYDRLAAFFEPQVAGLRERGRAFVLVSIEHAAALTSPGYDVGIAEREMTERWLAHHTSLARASGDATLER